jgi:hypothetical protein
MTSLRYHTFARSLVCAGCGLRGEYFAVERSRHQDTEFFHLNLYGRNADGGEVMLTKDHVVPRSGRQELAIEHADDVLAMQPAEGERGRENHN